MSINYKTFIVCVSLICLTVIYRANSEQALAAPFSGNHFIETTIQNIEPQQAYPKKIIDATGFEHIIKAPPKRIVSTSLAGDEILIHLAPLNSIASVTYLVDVKGASTQHGQFPKSIHRNRANIEEILSLTPDLVIVASYTNANTISLLFSSGIPVIRLNEAKSYQAIEDNIMLVAEILNVEEKGKAWINSMENNLADIAKDFSNQQKPKVLSYDLSGGSTGAGSLIDAMITSAGGINVLDSTGIQGDTKISQELAISLNPDIILTGDWQLDGAKYFRQHLKNSPAWQHVNAVQKNNIIGIQSAWLTSATPHRVGGVKLLAEKIKQWQNSSEEHNLESSLPKNKQSQRTQHD